MRTISLPQTTYNNLVKKAQVLEQFLALLKKEYPLEEYSKKQIQEFKISDRISPRLRKDMRILDNFSGKF